MDFSGDFRAGFSGSIVLYFKVLFYASSAQIATQNNTKLTFHETGQASPHIVQCIHTSCSQMLWSAYLGLPELNSASPSLTKIGGVRFVKLLSFSFRAFLLSAPSFPWLGQGKAIHARALYTTLVSERVLLVSFLLSVEC